MFKKTYLVILMLIVGAVTVKAQWSLNHTGTIFPDGSAMALNSIHMINESTLIIVTGEGGIVKTVNGGASWSVKISPGATGHINHIWMNEAGTNALTVANAGIVYKSVDAGDTWNSISTGYSQDLYGISYVDDNNIYACGTSIVLKSTDAGETWDSLSNPTASGKDLNSISFADANVGFTGGKTNIVYRTVNGGVSWDSVHNAGGTVRDIQVMNALNLLVIGDAGIQKTTDGGGTWTEITYPEGEKLWRGHFMDANNGLAVGQNGLVIKTTDGGTTWTKEESGSSSKLRGVFLYDTGIGAVSGQGDEIITMGVEEVVGFDSWTINYTNVTFPESSAKAINTAWMLSPNTIVVGTSEGGILKTVDGGGSWTSPIQPVGSGLDHINHIWFSDAGTDGLAFGNSGKIYQSADAGNSWNTIDLDTASNIIGYSVVDDDLIFACGTNVVLKSTDGGASWDYVTNPTEASKDLNSIAFVDANIGYTGGKTNIVYRTTDGGASWDSVYNAAGTVRDLKVWDALTFMVIGDGGIQKTTDGGATFATIDYPEGEKMWRSYFMDDNNGLAVGQNGLVILTTDGGNNWTKQESGSTSKLRGVFMFNGGTAVVTGQGDEVITTGVMVTSVEVNRSEVIPEGFNLSQNYPNPFNPTTQIEFSVPNSGDVQLIVFDALGRTVGELVNDQMSAGTYTVSFNATHLSSGIYFYKLVSQDFIQTKKMILIK
ncbi:MAG: T9SS type A sorting domain-containing protein [Melioribacteraceae bacterium]|nr:T9SS type A sorting domain-containing protein [Melioribacteraceae bacterium]